MTMTIGSLSTSEPLTHETASASGLRSRVAEIEPGKLFIDGAFRDAKSGKRRDNIDPSTGRVTTTVADGGAEDIDDAIAAARKAHEPGPGRG